MCPAGRKKTPADIWDLTGMIIREMWRWESCERSLRLRDTGSDRRRARRRIRGRGSENRWRHKGTDLCCWRGAERGMLFERRRVRGSGELRMRGEQRGARKLKDLQAARLFFWM